MAEFAARDAEHADHLAAERDKAEQARAELVHVADRLAQIAEANARSVVAAACRIKD